MTTLLILSCVALGGPQDVLVERAGAIEVSFVWMPDKGPVGWMAAAPPKNHWANQVWLFGRCQPGEPGFDGEWVIDWWLPARDGYLVRRPGGGYRLYVIPRQGRPHSRRVVIETSQVFRLPWWYDAEREQAEHIRKRYGAEPRAYRAGILGYTK